MIYFIYFGIINVGDYKMKHIDKFSLEYIENFKLYIGILKDEKEFSIVGILIKNEEVVEYCETIGMPNYRTVVEIFNILRNNKVFPSHFYNIIDDMYS